MVKEGLLRLVAMGVEVARCCLRGGHGRGVDECQMNKRAREKAGKRSGLHPAQLAWLRDANGRFPSNLPTNCRLSPEAPWPISPPPQPADVPIGEFLWPRPHTAGNESKLKLKQNSRARLCGSCYSRRFGRPQGFSWPVRKFLTVINSGRKSWPDPQQWGNRQRRQPDKQVSVLQSLVA